MDDFTNYPFPTYIPNKLIAYIFSSFVFLSFILWCIKSIQNHFQPIRLIILLFLSHLTICCELIIRATIFFTQTNSQTIYILITILYTIGQRSIIIANYTYLVQFSNKKFRFLFLGISLSILLSDILMTPAGLLSFQSDKIHLSFLFRQISTSIICLITILFYFIWFWTKTFSNMSYELIVLLIISNFNCLIIAFYLLIMSLPKYYIMFNDDEDWFYCFQILPIVLILIAWSILHPKQSLYVRNQLNIEKVPDEKVVSFIF
ncbi:unnamed protein product [Adineta steineri]|uniref:Uncharacterized protein n=1 Tax=Adineta steineri TaxID=433720 RepID=A0A818HEH5_9BILA|nr:unnamed protein product [Adineta steineri]CAF3503249.1 unnamed protein product [Adineta steineri]